ncbi:hypothetical protein SRO_6130 [Streptomyces rochei]|nr:hypothetical protein SRO_6130 [Streptomyces rochei]
MGRRFRPIRPGGARRFAHHRPGNRRRSTNVTQDMEGRRGCWLVALPAIDGKEYVYRVYAPRDALPADLFWEAWHCHDESALPRAWDLFDTAVIRHIG